MASAAARSKAVAARLYRRLRNELRDRAGRGNAGKWTDEYRGIEAIELYGDETTYHLAAQFLNDVGTVEDWGCGAGGFRRFCQTHYVGVDGSVSPFVDRVVDLETYRSEADGILLRHVLEHNYRWARVLDNALASFRSKLCVVLFTPFAPVTREIAYNEWIGVPDLSLAKADLVRRFGQLPWTSDENIATDTQYGVEHIFYVTRPLRA
jgi:hypothetical protein